MSFVLREKADVLFPLQAVSLYDLAEGPSDHTKGFEVEHRGKGEVGRGGLLGREAQVALSDVRKYGSKFSGKRELMSSHLLLKMGHAGEALLWSEPSPQDTQLCLFPIKQSPTV